MAISRQVNRQTNSRRTNPWPEATRRGANYLLDPIALCHLCAQKFRIEIRFT